MCFIPFYLRMTPFGSMTPPPSPQKGTSEGHSQNIAKILLSNNSCRGEQFDVIKGHSRSI